MSAKQVSRRTVLSAAAVGTAAASVSGGVSARAAAPAPAGPIVKPLPPEWFTDFGTNAEMRWDSVDPRRRLTDQARLFVRDHTSTPLIDKRDYELSIFGDGLDEARTADEAVTLSYRELRSLPATTLATVHECTGNGRSFFGTQQGTPAAGTQWTLGAVGAVRWEGVRLRTLLRHIGVSRDAVSIMATGLDAPYVSGGVDYGAVRRPFPIAKALDDALLAWSADGAPLLPDHGFPLRLVLPGWVGIASIKWLGSLEVSRSELTSPWNTKWYRMTGGAYPADSPALTVNPVRSAWQLPWAATLPARHSQTLTGRSWSGAAPIAKVDVSLNGGATWRRAELDRSHDDHHRHGSHDRGRDEAWTSWSVRWQRPAAGAYELLARATDRAGRVQPDVAPYNDGGYFFDAVVRHPVTVV